MTQKIANPQPIFLDARGTLIDGGAIYLGEPNADPQTSPVVAYWDSALTVVAAQPLATLGGFIVNGVTPAAVFIAEDDYSMRVLDAFDVLVFYSPSVFNQADQFQPKDSDLTAIAALSTTPFGRALLTLANQQALVSALGSLPYLGSGGGTVSGDISRASNGKYHFNVDSALTGRWYYTAVGAPDPTTNPGDIWVEIA